VQDREQIGQRVAFAEAASDRATERVGIRGACACELFPERVEPRCELALERGEEQLLLGGEVEVERRATSAIVIELNSRRPSIVAATSRIASRLACLSSSLRARCLSAIASR
jgi:hypothetical protein